MLRNAAYPRWGNPDDAIRHVRLGISNYSSLVAGVPNKHQSQVQLHAFTRTTCQKSSF